MIYYQNRVFAPSGTTLRDVLGMINMSYPDIPIPLLIMFKPETPDNKIEDSLVGYCEWDGHELTSLFNDEFSLEQEIATYRIVKSNRNRTRLCVTY